MEENKQKQEEPKKLSYEELQRMAGDLYQQNQKMLQQIRQMQDALERRDFDYTSFFLSMLFKVMEHPEMYKPEFVDWTAEHIQSALYAFAAASQPQEPEPKKDETE